MRSPTALAVCYQVASERGHRLELLGADADLRGQLICTCGATDELLSHLLEVAADALVDVGLLPSDARAELPGHPLLLSGTLAELLVAVGGRAV